MNLTIRHIVISSNLFTATLYAFQCIEIWELQSLLYSFVYACGALQAYTGLPYKE